MIDKSLVISITPGLAAWWRLLFIQEIRNSMDINYSLLLSIFYVKTRDFVNKKFFISIGKTPPLQVVSNSKFVSVGVQSPTEINAPRGCAVILIGTCQLRWPESRAKSHGRSTWISSYQKTHISKAADELLWLIT